MDIFLPSKRRWAGYVAEAKALRYYQQLGYILCLQNGRHFRAEVDLLLWHARDRHLVAVEVKYRSQAPELLPLTLRQARRIYRAACALRPKPLINEEVEVQLCLVLGNLESPQIQVFAEFYAPWD